MDIFNLLTMLGGLALFLYGMNQMGDGLEKTSSGRLETILEKLTSNPLKAVALGCGVTAIIQSSSATTVMVVGFVNSGIMKLAQAIPIIMGANVGTTMTAWLLSLTGVEGSSLFIQLLKPSSFSPVLAVVGTVMLMTGKDDKKKDMAGIFLGFAILMFGMDTMSGAVKPLADVPEFRNILTMFENPILGVLTGAVLTGVIQSSSASVGILQALSVTGSVSYAAAIPIIMGQNIGTCVTALLSCIGANKNARRTAMVHLYFNIIGTCVFLAAYAVVRSAFDLTIFSQSIDAAGVAVVHSAFNICCTVMLLPFSRALEKLACLTIPDRAAEVEQTVLLEERLLASSAIAISRCSDLICDMANIASNALMDSITLLGRFSPEAAQRIASEESEVDAYEDKLGSFLVKLSANNLSHEESLNVSRVLHGIGDLERISDHAVNICEVGQELHDKKIRFSEDAQGELDVLTAAVQDILGLAIHAYKTNSVEQAKLVEPLEDAIDDVIRELKQRHIERLQAGRCTVETGFIFNDLLANYERVADHCSNLAICVIELAQGELNAHEYASKTESGSDFAALYTAARTKYALPRAAAE